MLGRSSLQPMFLHLMPKSEVDQMFRAILATLVFLHRFPQFRAHGEEYQSVPSFHSACDVVVVQSENRSANLIKNFQ